MTNDRMRKFESATEWQFENDMILERRMNFERALAFCDLIAH